MVRRWELGRSVRSVVACLALAVGVIPLVTASTVEGQVPPVVGPPYSSSVFKFTTIIKDDKKDEGGGWQEARTVLLFSRSSSGSACLPSFTCNITVGMPVRNAKRGYLPAKWAGEVTALAATYAVTKLGTPAATTQPATYCQDIKGEMDKLFKSEENRDVGVVINIL